MIKNYDFKLDNGLRILLSTDETKYLKKAELITLFGSEVIALEVDNKRIDIPGGLAHFLEHTLIEKSMYGNAIEYMQDKYTRINGLTSSKLTSFYINGTEDINTRMEELISLVLNPVFDDIEDVKGPIIEEIKTSKNSRIKPFNQANEYQLFGHKFDNTLGEEEDIKNMTKEQLMEIYNIVYQPSNQILCLSGNFNKEEVKELVQKIYEKYPRTNIEFKKIKRETKDGILEREKTVIIPDLDEATRVTFKMKNIFSKKELMKLNHYLTFMLYNAFSDASDAYKYVVDNDITNYSINYSTFYHEEYGLIEITVWSNKTKESIDLILNTLSNFDMINEEKFKQYKNNNIVNAVIDSNHVHAISSKILNSVLKLDITDIADVDFYNSLTYQECIELLSKVSFDEYCITLLRNQDESN